LRERERERERDSVCVCDDKRRRERNKYRVRGGEIAWKLGVRARVPVSACVRETERKCKNILRFYSQ
jgi:hypothetical protein